MGWDTRFGHPIYVEDDAEGVHLHTLGDAAKRLLADQKRIPEVEYRKAANLMMWAAEDERPKVLKDAMSEFWKAIRASGQVISIDVQIPRRALAERPKLNLAPRGTTKPTGDIQKRLRDALIRAKALKPK